MKDRSIESVINRHIARVMTDLEDADCPILFRDFVKGRMQWLRSDLKELSEGLSDDGRLGKE